MVGEGVAVGPEVGLDVDEGVAMGAEVGLDAGEAAGEEPAHQQRQAL